MKRCADDAGHSNKPCVGGVDSFQPIHAVLLRG
jgi:hypothetical protein